jgi:hypothetical protein
MARRKAKRRLLPEEGTIRNHHVKTQISQGPKFQIPHLYTGVI